MPVMGRPCVLDAETCEMRATEYRHFATTAANETIRQRCLEIARLYGELAALLRELKPPPPPRPRA